MGVSRRIIFQVNGHFPVASKVGINQPKPAGFNLALIGVIDGVQRVEQQGDEIVVYVQDEGLISSVIQVLEAAHVPFHNIRSEQANLEDAFLALTGRDMRD